MLRLSSILVPLIKLTPVFLALCAAITLLEGTDEYSVSRAGLLLASGLVRGKRRVIVTDPINPAAARQMAEEIKKVTSQPVKLVIYSHNHWDHISGAGIFKSAGAKIIQHGNRHQQNFKRGGHAITATRRRSHCQAVMRTMRAPKTAPVRRSTRARSESSRHFSRSCSSLRVCESLARCSSSDPRPSR